MADTSAKQEEAAGGDGMITVEVDDNTPKHPLRCGWTLWFESNLLLKGRIQREWNVKDVLSFKNVEDFWRLHNNMRKPSQVPHGCGFDLFRNGVQPTWEDPANAKGGKWTVVMEKGNDMTDRMWLLFQLAVIGEMLQDDTGNFVCGAVCNLRKAQNKLCLWTRDYKDKERNMKVGVALKEQLKLPPNYKIKYQQHTVNPTDIYVV
jgi:translation initiation factor 4E